MEEVFCEAYINGYCISGCDACSSHYFKSEEAYEKNNFEYYQSQKKCKTLEKYRDKLV